MKRGIQPTNPDAFFEGRFKEKVLFVTGAAAGSIGGCTAIRAAREGARVFCIDIKQRELATTIDIIRQEGGKATGLLADISISENARNAVASCVKTYGGLHLVLNAAGIMDGTDPASQPDFDRSTQLLPAPIHMATDEYWQKVMATNITGLFYCLREELSHMVAQEEGGAIVNIGSIAAITGLPGNCAYSASKHAVTGITRNAAIDYAKYGIRVNSVNMAQTDTPMVSRAYEFVKWAMAKGKGNSMAATKSASLLGLNEPGGRGATPWEQAAIILFLLSADASNMTGACIATDGGWTTY